MIPWALLGIAIFGLFMAYLVFQGTRAALAWRKAAADGDLKVIADIVEDSISAWRSMKKPKEVAPDIWRGLQSMQLAAVEADFVAVSCQAEGEYKLVEGRWLEVSNPLQEGFGIAARATEMLFYDLPHFRTERIQVDVYTTFRDAAGATGRECVLTLSTTRDLAKQVDWEEWTAHQTVDALGGRYSIGQGGQPNPVTPPDLPASLPESVPEANGRRAAASR